jgi:PAS domain-containing protein
VTQPLQQMRENDGLAWHQASLGLTLLPACGGALYFAAALSHNFGFDESTAWIVAAISLASIAAACLSHHGFLTAQTARRRLEAAWQQASADRDKARANHALLQSAFDVMPEPLIIFDADDRVVLWNKLYAEQTGVAPGVGHRDLRRGMTFTELMRANLAKGRFPAAVGREEEWLTERLADHIRGGPNSNCQASIGFASNRAGCPGAAGSAYEPTSPN